MELGYFFSLDRVNLVKKKKEKVSIPRWNGLSIYSY